MFTAVVVEMLKRVSRQVKELVIMNLILLLMMLTEAVVVNMLLFVKTRIFDFDSGLEIRISPLELRRLTKHQYYALKLQPIDRARSQLSKMPLIAFLLLLQAKISRIG
eukprot:scaffold15883_cov155-Skeletonema_dohrnii-CCMP3373.AAC.2